MGITSVLGALGMEGAGRISCEMGSDVALLERARSGDEEACRAFIARYGERLHRIIERAHGDLQVSEDIVQETLVRAMRQSGQLREETAALPWLVRIALRIALDHRRKHHRERPVSNVPEDISAPSASPEAESAALELRDRVRSALEALPAYPRELLTLMYFAHFSVAELAEVFEKSEVAIRKDLQRARGRLRRRLGPLFEEAQ